MNYKEMLQNVDFKTLKELKSISEAEMFDIIGDKSLQEGVISEEDFKDTVLELAQTKPRASFYEEIKALGLSRNSKVVRAVEPLLKD